MSDLPAGSANNKASDYLAFVSGYLYRRLRYEARDLGIRWTALMVLNDLALLGASNQRTLAEIEQMSEPTMTVLLGQMRKQGWIRRQTDRRDARANLIAITPKGQRELFSAGRHLRQGLESELQGLSKRDLQDIENALRPLFDLLMQRIGQSRRKI